MQSTTWEHMESKRNAGQPRRIWAAFSDIFWIQPSKTQKSFLKRRFFAFLVIQFGCHQNADRHGGRETMRAQAPVTLSVIPARLACFASVWRPFMARTSPKECCKKKCKLHVKINLLYMYKCSGPCDLTPEYVATMIVCMQINIKVWYRTAAIRPSCLPQLGSVLRMLRLVFHQWVHSASFQRHQCTVDSSSFP